MNEDYGKKIYNLLVGALVVAGVVGVLWFFNRSSEEPSQDRAQSCTSLMNTVITRERSGDTSGSINSELDALGDNCPEEYGVVTDYVQIKGFYEADAGGPCKEYRDYNVRPAAIALARQDGFCVP